MISTGIGNQNNNIQLKIKPEYAREWGILPPDKYSQLRIYYTWRAKESNNCR
jgi:hypothetical protein